LAFRRGVTSFGGLFAHRGCFCVEIVMTIALTPHRLLHGFDVLQEADVMLWETMAPRAVT
jgi:hypothetical protein